MYTEKNAGRRVERGSIEIPALTMKIYRLLDGIRTSSASSHGLISLLLVIIKRTGTIIYCGKKMKI